MKLSDINPHIRYAAAHHHNFKEDFDRICYDCRIFFIKNGSGYVIANDKEYHFSNNTVFYFPPGTQYHFHLDKSCNSLFFIVVNFDLVNTFSHIGKSLGTGSTKNFDYEKLITYPVPEEFNTIICKTVLSIAPYLDKCCEEFFQKNSFYRETLSALLKLCLIDLIKSFEKNPETDKVQNILNYIHNNYHDTTLSNESVARSFNYHPYYLSQLIRQYTNQPLHRYLITYRIKMAKQKLVTTNESVNTIAWKTGFPSTAYFIKQFKSKTGMTPNTYRKERLSSLF